MEQCMRSRRNNIVVIATLIWLTTAYLLFSAYRTYRMFQVTRATDAVYSKMVSLPSALERYQQRFGSPPSNLERLIPEFLPSIPSSPGIDSVNYRTTPDGKHWELTLIGHSLGATRTYLVRPSWVSPMQGGAGFIGIFHGWTVYSH